MKTILDSIQENVLAKHTENAQYARDFVNFISTNLSATVTEKEGTYIIKSTRYGSARITVQSDPGGVDFSFTYRYKKASPSLTAVCNAYGTVTLNEETGYTDYKIQLPITNDNLQDIVNNVLFKLFNVGPIPAKN